MSKRFSPRALRAALRCHDMTVTFCRFCLRRHMSLVGSRVYRVSVLRSNIQKKYAHRHSLIAMFSPTYTLCHCEWRGNLARSGGYRAEGWLQMDRGAGALTGLKAVRQCSGAAGTCPAPGASSAPRGQVATSCDTCSLAELFSSVTLPSGEILTCTRFWVGGCRATLLGRVRR